MADTSLWVSVALPLGAAVIGAAAGLAGVVLAPRATGEREHEQWLRGKRAEVLEAFFLILQTARNQALLREGAGNNLQVFMTADPSLLKNDELRALDRELQWASDRMDLYSSRELSLITKTCILHHTLMLASVIGERVDESGKQRHLFLESSHEAENMIRDELRVA